MQPLNVSIQQVKWAGAPLHCAWTWLPLRKGKVNYLYLYLTVAPNPLGRWSLCLEWSEVKWSQNILVIIFEAFC